MPTGEMPRTVQLLADRTLVGRVTPGRRVVVVGVYSAIKAVGKGEKRGPAAVQQAYIRLVGLRDEVRTRAVAQLHLGVAGCVSVLT